MQLTGEANNQDLTSEIDSLCDSDSTSYPLADKVRRLNIALETLVAQILEVDKYYQYDDTNHTDQPVGTGNLVEGQEAYTFTSEYLSVYSVEVLDSNDVWRKMTQIDPDMIPEGMTIDEYFGSTNTTTQTGMPSHYDIHGDTVRLYPAPTATYVTLTAGLRIRFQRTVDLFTVADTTQEPGLPSPYHSLIAYMAAIPYCMTYHPDRVVLYQSLVDRRTASLLSFYSKRNKDHRPIMTMKRIRHI